jgi:hypothetical protein
MALPPFLESTDLSPPEAELGPVDFPVSTACAPAPAKGNANKPAARSNEREIEIIAVSSPFPNLAARSCGADYQNGRASNRLWIPQCGTRRIDVLRLLNAKVPNHVVRMGFDEITVRHKK